MAYMKPIGIDKGLAGDYLMGNAAKNDLRDKIRLESLLSRDLEKYFHKIASSFEFFARNKTPLNLVDRFSSDLERILISHYERTEKIFSFRTRKVLQDGIKSTVKEDAEIKKALDHFNKIRAAFQANFINMTSEKDIEEALQIASTLDTEVSELVDGVIVSKKSFVTGFELIITAKKILQRKLKARIPVISTTETQTAAEVSKLTETEVLTGARASIFGGGGKKNTK